MKTLVTYFSQTGNTKKIAEAIYEAISMEKEIRPLNEVVTLDNYDFTFIGFPVMNDYPVAKAKKFIKKQAIGKKIAMFVTHATAPGMPQEYVPEGKLDEILQNCKDSAAKSELVGFYDCMGELDEKTANFLLTMDDPILQGFGKIRPETIGHPNETEVQNARSFATEVMKKLNK